MLKQYKINKDNKNENKQTKIFWDLFIEKLFLKQIKARTKGITEQIKQQITELIFLKNK